MCFKIIWFVLVENVLWTSSFFAVLRNNNETAFTNIIITQECYVYSTWQRLLAKQNDPPCSLAPSTSLMILLSRCAVTSQINSSEWRDFCLRNIFLATKRLLSNHLSAKLSFIKTKFIHINYIVKEKKKKHLRKDIKLHIQKIMVPTKNRGTKNFHAKKAYTKQWPNH